MPITVRKDYPFLSGFHPRPLPIDLRHFSQGGAIVPAPFHSTATDVFQRDDLPFPLSMWKSLCGFVKNTVEPGALVVTDDWNGYAGLEKCGYKHFAATEVGDPSVAEECLPSLHLVFANLKSWLLGIHHGVSHRHFQAYLNEFTFRFNRRFYPFNVLHSRLIIAGADAAPTYDELYSGQWQRPTCWGCG